MPRWEAWLEMAEESLEAAGKIVSTAVRSAASRYYYAAYQAASALLMYNHVQVPKDREAWSHEDTRSLIITNLPDRILSLHGRREMSKRLSRLYKVRLSADYISDDNVTTHIETVRKDADAVVKIARIIIGEGRS